MYKHHTQQASWYASLELQLHVCFQVMGGGFSLALPWRRRCQCFGKRRRVGFSLYSVLGSLFLGIGIKLSLIPLS